ncbi:glutathione hydrolase 1 proenzyme [Nematostella vectensis]|uniref:glutathione hydrolase 1 proenzyme n=1 Tax=Nematostella vectensis TaxID=45351 RepID=UPI00207718B7|nr:glutathione hydrolase 1 proenzyme [Nematostella vectensis]
MRQEGSSGGQEPQQEELADTESLLQHSEDQLDIIEMDQKPTKCNRKKGVRVIVVSCLVFAVAVTIALIIDIYVGDHHTGHAAVSSDVKECSDIGLDLMKRGGSAVDAAIGALLCVGLMNPESCGIGGGGFMLIVPPRKKGEVIDFRETAPGKASEGMHKGNEELAATGGLAVAVPGELRGYEIAHKKYGKLKWAELFAPTIKLARDGFQVSAHTVKVLKNPKVEMRLKNGSPRLFKMLTPNGTLPKVGDMIRNKELADTLEIIAREGPDAFYTGDIAQSIVKTVQGSNDGVITLDDLKNYKALEKDGLNSTYEGYQITTIPLPGSGPVLFSALNILEQFQFSKADKGKNETYQYIVEALKFAYAQRTHLGDPADPANAHMQNVTNAMLSKKLAAKLRKKIFANQTFPPSYYGPFFDAAESHGTAHLSVVGPDGELVSVTSTINGYFGSYLMTDTGIILNNEMDDFSSPGITNQFGIKPAKANYIRPGKRPLSSMVPVVVRHKQDPCTYRLALGGSGGTRITTAVLQTLINILSFGNSLSEAVERPRVHHQFSPDVVEAEGERFAKYDDTHVISYLRQIGHKVNTTGFPVADVNVAENYHGTMRSHSDSRRDGSGSSQY